MLFREAGEERRAIGGWAATAAGKTQESSSRGWEKAIGNE